MSVNQTTVQLLKILSSQNKGKKSKKLFSKRTYPKGIENRYKMKLTAYYKPLIDYVKKFLAENSEQILHGDSSEVRLDAIPGNTYAKMVKNMEAWITAYFPEDPDENTKIYSGMKESAKELKEFEDREFEKQLEKSINVSIKEQSEWWPTMSENWANTNYKLIRSNASAFTDKINMIVERAVTNGTTVRDLQAEIQKATTGLSDYKCRLLARDQIGKLQGQISQGQMEEIGLDMYIWSTSGDERVRDSHQEMEGLLCRWDDATVYSEDGGKHWIPRPSGAVDMHPGQDIQCRCVALAYFPEIESVATGTSLNEQTEGLPDVQDLPQFEDIKYTQNEINAVNYWTEGNEGWAYQDIRAIANGQPIEETSLVGKQIKLNNMNRAEDLKNYLQKIYNDFDKAVKKSLPPKEEFLYRISPTLNVPKVGESFNLEKFSSFTFKPTESFYNNFNKGDGTVMYILKTDKNFADISKIGTSFTQEYEAVSKNAMSYKVTGVINKKIQGKTYNIVSLEYEKTNKIVPKKYIPPKKVEVTKSEKDFYDKLDFQMKVVTEAMKRGVDLSDAEAIKKIMNEIKKIKIS